MIRSILLDTYAHEDSLEIYFIFFRALLYFYVGELLEWMDGMIEKGSAKNN
jgi:hypothetical protein